MQLRDARKGVLFLGLVAVLALGGVAGVAHSQSDAIPEWIRNLFVFWTDEQVGDSELLAAIEFLVDEGVIQTSQSDRISDLEQTVEELRQENAALKEENASLQSGGSQDAMIEENTRAPIFTATESPILGSPDAGITIVEFGDYQCPNCKSWFVNTKPSIQEDYIQTGKANLVFVDIAFIGPDSLSAAQASYCAEDQGMYWEYHDTLYASQSGYKNGWAAVDNLKGFAADLGLDTELFDECLDSGKYLDRVNANTAAARDHGVPRTPSFLIISSDGQQEDITGNQPFSAFKSVIDALG